MADNADLARLRERLIELGDRRKAFDIGHYWNACEEAEQAISELMAELEQLRETTMQQAHHQRVVDAAAAAIAEERDRYRDDAERLRDGVTIGVYSHGDGHRDWWSGGTWLYPGESVVVIDAAKDAK